MKNQIKNNETVKNNAMMQDFLSPVSGWKAFHLYIGLMRGLGLVLSDSLFCFYRDRLVSFLVGAGNIAGKDVERCRTKGKYHIVKFFLRKFITI